MKKKYAPTSDFLSYVHILYPFKNEKEVQQLLKGKQI